MAIDFKTKTGGQSEPTQDINVESPDNTVNISQSRSSEEEKIFDLSIKDKIEVQGVDGGAVNVEKSFNGSTGVTTFEVSANNATEQNDGFLRAVGKYQIDHAQLIETEEQSESANDAAISLISKDSEYFPVDGQMMTWKDSEGKLHLSRYEGQPNLYDFPKKNWIQAVYTNDGYIVVLSKSGNEQNPSAGDFLIARSNGNGKWETFYSSGYENWADLFYFSNDNLIIALSRNSSQEIMLSYDSGLTWTKKTLPSISYWENIWIDWDGNYVFLNRNSGDSICVKTSDFNTYIDCTNDYPAKVNMCSYVGTNKFGSSTGWICFAREDNYGVNYTRKSNGEWQKLFKGTSYYDYDKLIIYKVFCINDNTYTDIYTLIDKDYPTKGCFIHINRELYDVQSVLIAEPSNFIIPISYEKIDYYYYRFTFITGKNDGLYKEIYYGRIDNFFNKEFSEKIFDGNYCHFTKLGEDQQIINVFSFGGVFYDNSGNQSNFNARISADRTTQKINIIPPDNWREIPLIDDQEEGFLFAQDGQAKTANLGDFLSKEVIDGGTVLKTVHSDRTTEYSNYRMLSAQGNVIWVQVAPASMVDNTTKVYSDEACTIEIGIVTAHSYNPNNPNDVTVMIDGESFVYVFQESKTPQSLATTAALISAIKDAIEEKDVSILFDGSNFSFAQISEIENLKSAFLTRNFKLIPSLVIYYGSNLLSICIPINIYVTDDYKFNVVYKSFRTLLTGTFTLSIDILSSNHTINFTPE